jgi:hypothetical protein
LAPATVLAVAFLIVIGREDRTIDVRSGSVRLGAILWTALVFFDIYLGRTGGHDEDRFHRIDLRIWLLRHGLAGVGLLAGIGARLARRRVARDRGATGLAARGTLIPCRGVG